jgi:phosphatidylserine/phosphatidylglycerophosphate/cardiolipin synthase-like enzyme
MLRSLLAVFLLTFNAVGLSAGIPATVEVYFSPTGGAADALIHEIENAKSEIRVQAYSFTHAGIVGALTKAKRRGVDVEIILDKSNRTSHYSAADFVSRAGIPTYIDAQHAIAHNKIMIIDRKIVVTGSFNFTKAADQENAENLLILHSQGLARIYLNNWRQHEAHSGIYQAISSY